MSDAEHLRLLSTTMISMLYLILPYGIGASILLEDISVRMRSEDQEIRKEAANNLLLWISLPITGPFILIFYMLKALFNTTIFIGSNITNKSPIEEDKDDIFCSSCRNKINKGVYR